MNAPLTIKQKKCRMCPVMFTQFNSLHVVCSPACAIRMAEEKPKALVTLGQRRLKEERKADRQKKLAAKTRQQWLKEVQSEINRFVRLRDANQPCISCQRFHSGQYHAGHYRTVGACPSLRFEESNIHKQCSACNNHLSGNIVEYRINLLKKIGAEKLAWLEGPHEPKHYKIPELIELKAHYKLKCKELENDSN